MELSPVVEALIREFESDKRPARDGARLSVSRTVSLLAVLYEKARNAVEFRAEHLVRRASIERILKRRIVLSGNGSTIAENLITELLWARYIDSTLIDKKTIEDVQKVIDRYLIVKQHCFQNSHTYKGIAWDGILGLASSEIEETIVSSSKRDALTNFFYQAVRPKIQIPDRDETYINTQTFIASERVFALSDEALISYHLLKLMLPNWFGVSPENTADMIPSVIANIQHIASHLKDPTGANLYRYLRKYNPPFFLIRELFISLDDKIRSVVNDAALLEQKLAELASSRYQEIGSRNRRAIVRSFIYIFLTKMVFALALEIPYDRYIAHHLSIIPLVINMLFPPLLMVAVAGLITVPGGDNTRRLIERINKILFHFNELKNESDVFVLKENVKRPLLTGFFTLFYLAMFGLTFLFINSILSLLQFNIASRIIFVFFVALVVFFAYRIRQSAKEYEIVDRSGILEPIMDFFFLPILRAGYLLSQEISRLNVFIFLFDFVLEAPLKIIFEVAEEWIRFIRTKKEEIV